MESLLLIFDIDHTLLNTLEFQSRAYEAMFPAVLGIHAKLTDVPNGGPGLMAPDIIRLISLKHGLSETQVTHKIPDAERFLAKELKKILPSDPRPHMLLGVPDILVELKKRRRLGVISGNSELVATTLLTWAGVRDLFDVSCFSDEARDRRHLIKQCMLKYESLYQCQLETHQVVMVGDSAADMASARAIGVYAVGVTTGFHSREDLISNGASLVISSLKELSYALAMK